MKTEFILVANLFLSIFTSGALTAITFMMSGHLLLACVVYSLSGASVLVAMSVWMSRRMEQGLQPARS